MKAFSKVIVVGLDGLEPKIVEAMLAAGELPNLERLRSQGGFSRVATTTPAQTPVAWSTFATGTNPGGHGIFDFLRRNPQTYLPDLALNRYEQKNPFVPPKAVNLRGGTPLWEILGQAGISSSVIRCPCTYPPDPVRGRMLAGMGTPDLRGGLGTPTFYTSAAGVAQGESENVVPLVPGPDGAIETHLIGPRHPRNRTDILLPIKIQVDRQSARAVLRSDGTPAELILPLGQWTDWLRVKFPTGLFQSVRGMVRFCLVRMEPQLELYASPINFDPGAPLFPISSPPEYAKELAERLGPYYTTGMVEEHTGLNNGRISPEAFLDQCVGVWHERQAMLMAELERRESGFVFCLFDTPDRVQHMFWRYREPGHPANQGGVPAEHRRAIEEHYRLGDDVVGRALQYADDRTLFIVLSDHGFNSFQRGVCLNSWLHEHGLLALRDGARPGSESGDLLRNVDWSRTKAYGIGLSGLYLNMQGREGQGVVSRDDAERLKAELAAALPRLTDPGRGASPIRSVQTREEVYSGPYAGDSPDLLVNYEEGYRVSWSTAMGGVARHAVEDNLKPWSGDHIIDPALVPGVLLMNRPFEGAGARLVDLAPTILTALGVATGPLMEGRSLLR